MFSSVGIIYFLILTYFIAWTYPDAVTLIQPVLIRVCAMQHAPRNTGVVWLVPTSHILTFPVEIMGSLASVLRASVSSLRNGEHVTCHYLARWTDTLACNNFEPRECLWLSLLPNPC